MVRLTGWDPGRAATRAGATPPLDAIPYRSEMGDLQHFMARLVGTRPTWPHDITSDESNVMARHFDYLSDAVVSGRVLFAGPCFEDPPVGLVLLAAVDESEARQFIELDPSVTAGLHTVELARVRLALWAGAHRRTADDP